MDSFLPYYGSYLFKHLKKYPEMNSIFCRYSPFPICRLYCHSLLSSHPSDCNIATQYSHHKKISSGLALALAIGLNNYNSATEKESTSKLLYKSKSGVSDGYAWIGSILIIYWSWRHYSVLTSLARKNAHQYLLLPHGWEITRFTNHVKVSPSLSLRDDLIHRDVG